MARTLNYQYDGNQVFNHNFIYPNESGDFAAGWQKSRGAKNSSFTWEKDDELEDGSIAIKNKSNQFGSISQQKTYSMPVAGEQIWEVGAVVKANIRSQLVIIIHFQSDSFSRVLRVSLDFLVDGDEEYHFGIVSVPAGINSAFLELGLKETGTVWIQEVIFRRIFPPEKFSIDPQGRLNVNKVTTVGRILEPLSLTQPLEVNARLLKEYRETTEDLVAENRPKTSAIHDFTNLDEYSFFAMNQGHEDVWLQIELSPNGVNWVNDSQKTRLKGGAMEIMVCDHFLKYGRIKYYTESKTACNLRIIFQGRS
ncbi:MAG: DUF6385 domain-containing protein [Syntrophomonas sp.]